MAIRNLRYGFVARTIGEWNAYANEIKAASGNRPWIPNLGEYIFIKNDNTNIVNTYCIGDGTTEWETLKENQKNINNFTSPNLTEEIERAKEVEQELDNKITAEYNRATTKEGELSDDINNLLNIINRPEGSTETIFGVIGIQDDKGTLRDRLTTVEDRVTAFLDSEEIDQTVDTLKEIQQWINEHGVEATNLAAALAAETTTRTKADSVLDDRLDIIEGDENTAGSIRKAIKDETTARDNAISAEVQRADDKYATEADLIQAEGRIENLESKPGLDKVGTVIGVVATEDLKSTGSDGGIFTIALSDKTKNSLKKANTALQEHQNISHLATKEEVNTLKGYITNSNSYQGESIEIRLDLVERNLNDEIETRMNEIERLEYIISDLEEQIKTLKERLNNNTEA